MIAPLRVHVDLACEREHAFRTWTERIDTWWPRGHTSTGDASVSVHLEPRVGGRIFERDPDGAEVDWGEIREWDPPRRLAYTWHLRRDRADATAVELTFVEVGEATTRLEIVHTGWERLGDGDAARDANHVGWAGLLPHFQAACEPDAAPSPRGAR